MNWLREPDAEPIPGYKLICPLGTGGFGEVWKCTAPGGIFKAIKFVYGNLHSVDGDAVRAEQEFKAMQRVKEVRHPFVLSIERIDEVAGELVIVMELADKSLHDLNQECVATGLPGIPRDDLLRYIRDAADGLDHLIEKHNLQHLDVKPRNLFLIGDRVKVADFGLVKNLERQSSSGLMAGVTPLYAPPETFSGKLSKSADQYSLAIVYQELLTGTRPYNGRNIRQLALQHISENPDLTPIPECDRPAMARALSKNPDDRFPTCLDFVRALYESIHRPRSDMNLDLRLGRSTANISLPAPPPLHPPPAARVKASEAEITMAQAEVGVLRPTLLVGVGSFGRRALVDLRCRLLDRFGDLAQVPIFRFLYIDCDPEAIHKATNDAPDVALSSTEVFPLPLQPVSNYRKRVLEHLTEWLPREKLYSISRSLQPQGVRALGRLAFSDNYLRLMTRLKRELQVATHPESLSQSVGATGLNLRDNTAQVLVFASGCGGTSGLLADLGFAISRQMELQRLVIAPPALYLYCGAPADPATPRSEQANLYATMTELNHYSDPTVSFFAQYGPDGAKIHETRLPYSTIHLLTLPNRSPQDHRDAVAKLSSFLSHEMTTPLGGQLELKRTPSVSGASTAFRSLGAHGIWFPRGLLLRVAARQACARLIADWQETHAFVTPEEIERMVTPALSDEGMRWESLATQMNEAARTPADGSPGEALARVLAELEEDAGREEIQINPFPWARQAMERIDEWIGVRSPGTEASTVWKRARLGVALQQAAPKLAEEWDRRWFKQLSMSVDRPGRRVALAEAALTRMVAFAGQAAQAQREAVGEHRHMTDNLREQAARALESCRTPPGGISRWFGSSGEKQLRQFLEHLRSFTHARLIEDTLEAGYQFFNRLRARLEEQARDLGFIRQRLRNLQEGLEMPLAPAWDPAAVEKSPMPRSGDSFSAIFEGSDTVQVVLPNAASTLEQAADQFLYQMPAEEYQRLDEAIQALVLAPQGGLLGICRNNSDLLRALGSPLIDQAAAFLSERMPVTDVAAVQFSAASSLGETIGQTIADCYDAAVPFVVGKRSANDSWLMVPDSEAGRRFGEEATKLHPRLRLIPLAIHTDLTFCREQEPLKIDDLRAALALSKNAYEECYRAPPVSPHSRFDMTEWMPLDP